MRKSIFLSILGFILVTAVIVGYRYQVSAFSCSYSRGPCGYFTDVNVNANNNVLPNPALTNINNSNAFAVRMAGFLFSANAWRSTGAAFVIDSMLNYRGSVGVPVGGGQGAGVAFARNNFGNWQNLINFYGNSPYPGTYGVIWRNWPSAATYCDGGGKNGSGFDTARNDAALYHVPRFGTAGCQFEWVSSMPEITFYWPGGSFSIGTLCGNVQDSLSPIPGPNNAPFGNISVACNPANGQQVATVNFGDPDSGTDGFITVNGWTSGTVGSGGSQTIGIPLPPFTNPYVAQTVTLHIRDAGVVAPPGAYVTVNASTAVPCVSIGCGSLAVTPIRLDPYMPYSITISVTNNVGQTPPGANFNLTIAPPAGGTGFSGSQAAGGGGGVSTATFNSLGPTNKAGIYNAQWTFTAPGINTSCSGSFPVIYLPYLGVYGGDVASGASASYSAGASACTVDSNAGIFSWNNHTAGYSGAGAEYAVQALAGVVDFASALGSSNVPPTGLSFANYYNPADGTKLNASQGLFGGWWGGTTGDCDFTSDLTGPPITVNTTIGATVIGKGVSNTKYVSGADVYISGNIAYTTAGWLSITDIPYFKLVVTGGDIYIDHGVTQLDGLFIAEPSAGIGGRIFTCAVGLRNPVSLGTAGSYTTCNQQLVINGAFVARAVAFGRTYGSVGQATGADSLASNHNAEVFNYTPETWLPRSSAASGSYMAITGLPPVL